MLVSVIVFFGVIGYNLEYTYLYAILFIIWEMLFPALLSLPGGCAASHEEYKPRLSEYYNAKMWEVHFCFKDINLRRYEHENRSENKG